VDIATIIAAVGAVGAEGGIADTVFLNPADLTAIRQAVAAGTSIIADPSAPGVERIAGAQLLPTAALTAGTAVVCQASYIVLGSTSRRGRGVLLGLSLHQGCGGGPRDHEARLASRRPERLLRHRLMADERWTARADVVVRGRAVEAGRTFTAPAAAVGHAVARGLVEKAGVKATKDKARP
jgi:hypothetical protein